MKVSRRPLKPTIMSATISVSLFERTRICADPGQELGIAADIGDEVEHLLAAIGQPAGFGVPGISPSHAPSQAGLAGGAHLREIVAGVIARPRQRRSRRPAGSPWRGRSRHRRRTPAGVTKSSDLGVARGRLEILAHGQEIDVGGAHVVHHLMDFEPLLAQPDHDARLGEDRRIVPLHLLEQPQRGIIARAGADRRIEPRHGFEIVVVDVGPRRDDRLDRGLRLVAEVGRQDLDRGVGRGAAERLDHLDELARAAIGQVVAIDRGDDDMLEPQLGRRVGDVLAARADRPRAACRS